MSLTTFLTGLLSSIIRPIIKEELSELKAFFIQRTERLEQYEKFEKEADKLIFAAQQATTTEEVKAHLRNLKAARPSIRNQRA